MGKNVEKNSVSQNETHKDFFNEITEGVDKMASAMDGFWDEFSKCIL